MHFFEMSRNEVEMSITERQKQILKLLREEGYLSVERLANLTYTSASSIRRDLKQLQMQSLIRRTHGGASLPGEINHPIPLTSRMTRNIAAKKKIAKKAASLLKDGISVMLDGSSTVGFLVPYMAGYKNVTVFTNNMQTAISAIGYGLQTVCIGGTSVNHSAVLSGPTAYATVESICPDILFFSSQNIDLDGMISDPIEEENHIRQRMLKNAKLTVFLCDSEKCGERSLYTLTNLSEIDIAVFDEIPKQLNVRGCQML